MRVNGRAYSTLDIKAFDEDNGVITGIASTPSPDRMGDVVVPEGATFKLPLPLLWQHNPHKPIGHVTEAKVTKKGIEIVATIMRGVTEEIDNAWKMIRAGLVRGLSIGFRGIDMEQIPNSWGVIFEKWEWLELSAVTIPANAEASITSVKKFDVGAPPASAANARPGASGKSISVNLRPKEGNEMKTILEQIAALEQKRAANAARMQAVMQKSIEEGRSTDDGEQEEFDTLSAELEAIDKDIARLKIVEKAMAGAAKPVAQATTTEAGTQYRAGVVVKTTVRRAPGIGLARVVKCIGQAQGNVMQAFELAKTRYKDDDAVVATLKAAVDADFVEFLRPMTILGKFGVGGIPSLRNVPFRVPLISQTDGGDGYWVGEGKPKPLTKFSFARTTLEPLKVANIAVLTKEALRDSSPSAEMIVRDSLAAALRERLDLDFINPAKAASAGVSPASITNGVSAIVSTGNDSDAVREDIRLLMAEFIAANNAPTSAVFIMSSLTALALSQMRNPLGQKEFADINMMGGSLEGIPVITSEYVPSVSAGGYVVLVNAQDIYFADDGDITIDMSREASLQMNDAPTTQDALTGTGTSLVSLWQTNSVGFLAERSLNWAKRRSSAVAVLSGVNWGLPASA
jgi:HK97 family phage major capsid protein/HK97 family phage prohead protease